jgi:coenzyme Q-binding protein COQ10
MAFDSRRTYRAKQGDEGAQVQAEAMASFHTARRVRHSPLRMFDLVADIERYPEFVPLCLTARIRRRSTDASDADVLTVAMEVGYRAIRQRFTTRDVLDITRMKIRIGYIEGPFREFENIWAFHDEAAGACRVEFRPNINFEARFSTC